MHHIATVDTQGVHFGPNYWVSHETITGCVASEIERTRPEYWAWVQFGATHNLDQGDYDDLVRDAMRWRASKSIVYQCPSCATSMQVDPGAKAALSAESLDKLGASIESGIYPMETKNVSLKEFKQMYQDDNAVKTLRDEIAIAVLNGMESTPDDSTYNTPNVLTLQEWRDGKLTEKARYCYTMADFMLKARTYEQI